MRGVTRLHIRADARASPELAWRGCEAGRRLDHRGAEAGPIGARAVDQSEGAAEDLSGRELRRSQHSAGRGGIGIESEGAHEGRRGTRQDGEGKEKNTSLIWASWESKYLWEVQD